ncbi:hypothetical protein SDJN02_21788, partial [Cucurbita argyrosperma subsp. argyrosperma]
MAAMSDGKNLQAMRDVLIIMVVKSYLTDHLRRWLVWERAGSQYVNASLKSHEYWKEEAAR